MRNANCVRLVAAPRGGLRRGAAASAAGRAARLCAGQHRAGHSQVEGALGGGVVGHERVEYLLHGEVNGIRALGHARHVEVRGDRARELAKVAAKGALGVAGSAGGGGLGRVGMGQAGGGGGTGLLLQWRGGHKAGLAGLDAGPPARRAPPRPTSSGSLPRLSTQRKVVWRLLR